MQITVATITLERRGNADRMLQSMQILASRGIQAFVGDGGSSAGFVARLRDMGHTVVQPGRRLRGQFEAAFLGAAERGTHVFYFESDKVEFIETRLDATIRQYRSRGLDYAVVGRTQARWDTFPRAQREIERAQCVLMSDVIGIHGDWVAGPALLPSRHVEGVLGESRWAGTDRFGWAVPWYLLGRAWAGGLKIGIIRTATGVDSRGRAEFNPGYRLYQANAILGGFYEGVGIEYDWRSAYGDRLE